MAKGFFWQRGGQPAERDQPKKHILQKQHFFAKAGRVNPPTGPCSRNGPPTPLRENALICVCHRVFFFWPLLADWPAHPFAKQKRELRLPSLLFFLVPARGLACQSLCKKKIGFAFAIAASFSGPCSRTGPPIHVRQKQGFPFAMSASLSAPCLRTGPPTPAPKNIQFCFCHCFSFSGLCSRTGPLTPPRRNTTFCFCHCCFFFCALLADWPAHPYPRKN